MEEQEFTLYDYWITIRKRRWLILGLFLVFSMAGLVYSLLTPKTYKASATILPILEKDGMGTLKDIPSAASLVGFSQPASMSDIFLSLLKSRTMADQIVDKFGLQALYRAETKEGARRILSDMTEIKTSREKAILISVIDRSPQRAADMANCYVETLDELRKEFSVSYAGYTRQFIVKRMEETKKLLTEAEERLKNYQVNHVSEIRANTVVAGELQGRLAVARVDLESKSKYVTTRHPDMIRLRNEIAEIEKNLAVLPTVETEIARLYREVSLLEGTYSLLMTQYKQAEIEEAKDTPTLQVLDWAVPPEYKFKPKVKQNVALSGMTGLFLGVFIAIFLNGRLRQ